MTAIPQSLKRAERSPLAFLTDRVRPTTLWLIGCSVICAWFVIVPLAAIWAMLRWPLSATHSSLPSEAMPSAHLPTGRMVGV